MAPQKTHSWELKLAPIQLIIALVIVVGSMAAAFYLGFSSGQNVGYESALGATLSTMARLPIPTEDLDPKASDEMASEMYAKLTAPAPKEGAALKNTENTDHEMPEVGAIPSTESIPILPDSVEGNSPEKSAAKSVPSASQDATGRTLGSLVPQQQAEVKAPVAETQPEKSVEVAKENIPTSKTEDIIPTEKTEPKVEASKTTSQPVETVKEKTNTASVATAKKDAKDGIAPLREKLPQGWYVQVAAPQQLQEAYSIASQVQHMGIPVIIETAQVRGESYYRIVAGPRPQRQGAESLLEQIKNKHSIKADPFLRAVK